MSGAADGLGLGLSERSLERVQPASRRARRLLRAGLRPSGRRRWRRVPQLGGPPPDQCARMTVLPLVNEPLVGIGTASPDEHPAWPRWAVRAKRALDIVGATLTLVLGAPAFGLIALAVLITNGRPIFYRWEVVGQGGRPFTGYKFRTMVRDADQLRDELLPHNEMNGPVFKIRRDPRVTRLGRFLRSYSLDETPQFWSVLRGDMCLVGPRPLYPHEYERATPEQRRKLSVKPGITCLWQVSGRSRVADFSEWVALDLKYIDEWSIWVDVKILARTIPAVLWRRGAW